MLRCFTLLAALSAVSPAAAAEPPKAPANRLAEPLFADDFDSGARSDANGYAWSVPPNVQVVGDLAHSGNYSLRFRYPGKPNPCADAMAEQRLKLGHDLLEAWIEYRLYLPDGTEGLGAKFIHRLPACPTSGDAKGIVSNNKFFAIWDRDYAASHVKVVFEYRRLTAGPADDSYVYGMHGSDTRKTAQWGSKPWSPAISDATRGRWLPIRIQVKVADDPAAKNGGYRLWADGRLVIDHLDRDVAPQPGGNRFFRNLYLMGWSNSGFTEETNVYLDDFNIYGSNPGW